MPRNEKVRLIAAGAVLAAVAVTVADAAPQPSAAAPPAHRTAAPATRAPAPSPPDEAKKPGQPGRDVAVDAPGGTVGVPDTALRAYRTAAERTAVSRPNCHLSWSLVAAIGRVESNHARGGQVDGAGTTLSPILGPQLSGGGFAQIPDTDNGALDGDTEWDRAVGPMQFIPSTWRRNGLDANADGIASPHNMFDAASAAGRYLCARGRDLADDAQLKDAVFSYNPSQSYVDLVLKWQQAYASGIAVLPDGLSPDPLGLAAAPPDPAAAPAPAPPPPPDQTAPPPETPAPPGDQPPTEQCLLDLAALGVDPDDLLGIRTEVACQTYLLQLGPLRIDELPTLPRLDHPRSPS